MVALGEDLMELVKKIVCQVLEIETDEIDETSRFKADYGVDSMREIEILAALENHLRVRIDQSKLPRMVNLAGIWDVLAEEGMTHV